MRKDKLETLVGFMVIALVIACVAYSRQFMHVARGGEYTVHASFERADGIHKGSSVKVAGVQIGEVSEVRFDQKQAAAIVSMQISKNIIMPVDTSASICSEGLLGGKYIDITLGSNHKTIKNNGFMRYTNRSINLESLITRYMFSSKK